MSRPSKRKRASSTADTAPGPRKSSIPPSGRGDGERPAAAGHAGRRAYRRAGLKKLTKGLLLILSTLLLAAGLPAARIYSYRNASSNTPADAAVVLGAAVWGAEVSPVFRERINHGIDLYRRGRVRKLIFTGGRGNRGEPTESSAARAYAQRRGVPAGDILIEEKSTTTYENILYAKQLAEARGLRRVLIVSDPLHMKRAMAMAGDVGLAAEPSPTPSTRYRGMRSQAGQLAQETYYYIGYLLSRPFLGAPQV